MQRMARRHTNARIPNEYRDSAEFRIEVLPKRLACTKEFAAIVASGCSSYRYRVSLTLYSNQRMTVKGLFL
jgi:hypothetical protein